MTTARSLNLDGSQDELFQKADSQTVADLQPITDKKEDNAESTAQMSADRIRWLSWAAFTVALIFGLGCGATGAAALMAGGYSLLEDLSLGCFSLISNFYMTKGDVKKVFLGGIDGLFRVTDLPGAAYMSLAKQRMMKIGMFLSATFGVTMAALTYVAILKLATVSLFLPIASALPFVGVLAAVATILVQTSLMSRGFCEIIRIEDLKNKTLTWIGDTFLGRHKSELNKPKGFIFWLERGVMAFLAASILIPTILLICWGKINTLMSCAKGFSDILQKIPHAAPAVVHGVSFVVAQVLAFAAQMPFVMKVTVRPVVALFSRDLATDAEKEIRVEKEKNAPVPTTIEKVSKAVKGAGIIISAFLNSACMAAIAMQGKAHDLATTSGGVGAFTDGFVSSTVNAFLSEDEEPEQKSKPSDDTKPLASPSSTAAINSKLGTTLTNANALDVAAVTAAEQDHQRDKEQVGLSLVPPTANANDASLSSGQDTGYRATQRLSR